MLTNEKIEALLKIDTQNPNDTRLLRIMSCDTPIKDIFVYDLSKIKKEFGVNPQKFDSQLALCIYKYDSELKDYLEGNTDYINVKSSVIKLTKELISNSIEEIYGFYDLVQNVANQKDLSYDTLYKIVHFNFESYTQILQLCGLVNISDNIFRSKLLARILNAKEQVKNYKEDRMPYTTLEEEFIKHADYLSSQVKLIEENNLTQEDFLIYVIVFDIRHFKHNRKNRILIKW